MTAPPRDPVATGQLLSGVRVLDLTNVLAGPFCGYQLALQGAEVIKVEVPEGGDLARQLGADASLNKQSMGASFLAQNAGKKSITLNLKNEDAREIFLKLVNTADVLVENFRPGVMDRLGVGYTVLTERRPNLIYCAISGFGQDGPLRDRPAYDQIIQGLSGVMSVTGSRDTGPLRVGYPICDTLGGLTASFAIACALFRRRATGEGQFLDVSMLDATLATLGWAVSNWLIAGIEPSPMGNDNVTASPSGTFATGDGILNIAANKQEQFESLCRLIGREDLLTDCRFAEREGRKENRQALSQEIESALAAASAGHWEEALTKAGVPAGRVMSVPEALDSEQVKLREMTQTHLVPGVDRPVTVVKSGFKVSGFRRGTSRAPPQLSQHTHDILGQLGYSMQDITDLHTKGAI